MSTTHCNAPTLTLLLIVLGLMTLCPASQLLASDPTLSSGPTFISPICHYLDRGFDDHVPGRTDHYAIAPHGLRTLADLRHIELGLDLPLSHCEAQSHAVPCADHDDPQRWCVRRLALSVLGLKLFDASEPDGCLLSPRAGVGGQHTLESSDLRNHPQWGLTEEELSKLIAGFDPHTNAFRIPSIRFSSDYLARLIEGAVGEQLARYVKGCANKLYCGNRRGRLLDHLPDPDDGRGDLLPFWMNADDVNCDFTGCPAVDQRRSSPWVELRAQNDHLRVDLDIEIDRGKKDLDDHALYDTKVLPYFGSTYKQVARGSIGFDLGIECRRFIKIGNDKLSSCSETPDNVCYIEPVVPGAAEVKIKCPPGSTNPFCNQLVLNNRSHELQVTAGDPSFKSESGALTEALIEVLCLLTGKETEGGSCDFNDLGTQRVQKQLTASVFDLLPQEELDSCPEITIDPDGSVEIDFSTSGGLDSEANSISIDGTAPSESTDATLAETNGSVNDSAVGRGERPTESRETNLVPPRRIAQLARLYGKSTTGAAEPAKIPMAQLDSALRLVCALSRTCPGVDLAILPIDELVGLDLSNVQAIPKELDDLLKDSAFQQCVSGDIGPLSPPEILAWLTTKFQPALDGCAALRVEALLPLVGLELQIETAGSPVGDTFAFVDFGFWRESLQEKFGCLKRPFYPSSNAPTCDEGEDSDGKPCGTVLGGPCHDIRYPHSEWQRSAPEDAAYHPNGDFRWYTRCGNYTNNITDDAKAGKPMICVAEYYNGSGVNLAGTCKLCGTPGPDDDPFFFTTIGCRPEGDCPPGQFLGTNGRCWDIDAGVPEWECEADCASIFNDYGWCVHHGPWRSWMSAHPHFSDNPSTYQLPICAEHISCSQSGVPCAAKGQACQPDTGTCKEECIENADCQAPIPAPAYPKGFVCHPESLTCRL